MKSNDLSAKIGRILGILGSYGLICQISIDEFLTYVTAPTVTGDITTLKDIIENEFLILHELAEICIFKKMGVEINKEIFIKYPDLAYRNHLEAMRIELKYALTKNNKEWIKKRLTDLESYLNDPEMPQELRRICKALLEKYRNT